MSRMRSPVVTPPDAPSPSGFSKPPASTLGRLWGDRTARAGLIVACLVLGILAFGPLLMGGDPYLPHPGAALQGPSGAHLLGTDRYGRDEVARVIDGGRLSLLTASLVLVFGGAAGLAIGIAVGFAGGFVEAATMRLADVMLGLPDLIVVLAVLGALGPGTGNLVLALSLPTAAFVARLSRGCVLTSRRSPVVVAARCAGRPWTRVVAGHVLPDVATKVLVVLSMNLGTVVIGIAGLSFLGLGVQQPTPEWGAMLADARISMTVAPWLVVAPALGILLSVGAANLIADGLVRVGGAHGSG